MILYHGAHTEFNLHVGQCWARDVETAECYATSRGVVATAEIDFSGLKVVEVEGHDRDADYAAFAIRSQLVGIGGNHSSLNGAEWYQFGRGWVPASNEATLFDSRDDAEAAIQAAQIAGSACVVSVTV